jgi:LacI family transcriptional regulator
MSFVWPNKTCTLAAEKLFLASDETKAGHIVGSGPVREPMEIQARRPGPTIWDVARAAGVSIGSVSKALNNTGHLSKATRERIIAAANELGFRPNDLAQSLHRGQSLTVGLISTDAFGRFTIPIMEGIEECLSDRRMAVFMCNATDDPMREQWHVEHLVAKRVDGIIVTARRADKREKLKNPAGVPVVYVFSQVEDPDACCLLADDEAGAALAVKHLAQLGRRRIAHVTGPERFEAVRLRRDGYRKALAEAGLFEPNGFYRPGVWSEEWGRQAVADLFGSGRKHPDAIFCGSDQIGRGVADALREAGESVPESVSIVGFDNWRIVADATRPSLTTVDMNLAELGREGGRRLLDLIAGKVWKGVDRLPCSLIIRKSCGAEVPQVTAAGVPKAGWIPPPA